MRGAPLLDLLAVLLLGTLLAFPLRHLTRPVPAPAPERESPAADVSWEAWIDLRFSHPPLSYRLRENNRLLLEGANDLRTDADVVLSPRAGHVFLQLDIEWPADVEQGYVQVQVEPEDREARREGAWGRGHHQRSWEFVWPTH